MKMKIWVIGTLLLLAGLTGLAQSYHTTVNRTMNEKFEDKKLVIEAKEGNFSLIGDNLRIDDHTYKVIQREKDVKTQNGNSVYYTIWSPTDKQSRTYTIVLNYNNNGKIVCLEVWRSKLNRVYYVSDSELHSQFSAGDPQVSARTNRLRRVLHSDGQRYENPPGNN